MQLLIKKRKIFNLNVVSVYRNYLGLPFMVGRNRRKFSMSLKIEITTKLKGQTQSYFQVKGKKY